MKTLLYFMDVNTILSLIISFLGGGVVVAIFEWIRINKAEKVARRLSFLNDQIQKLYGPLYFFTAQNQRCFELNNSILKAYDKEYVPMQPTTPKQTQASSDHKSATITLDIANAYVVLATRNNDTIINIIKNNYSSIDPDDVEIFQQFVFDYNRLRTEVDETGRLGTPPEIYEHIGNISFMRPEFTGRVKAKFHSKKDEIKLLTNN